MGYKLTLTLAELIDVFISIDRAADYLWYIHLYINLSIVGILFFFDRPLRLGYKYMFVSVYLGISSIIYLSMLTDLNLMKEIQKDIVALSTNFSYVSNFVEALIGKDIDNAILIWRICCN